MLHGLPGTQARVGSRMSQARKAVRRAFLLIAPLLRVNRYHRAHLTVLIRAIISSRQWWYDSFGLAPKNGYLL